MGCARTSVRQLGRKKYSLARNLPREPQYVSNNNFEIENLIVEMLEDSTKTVEFDTPFSGKPSVVATFVTVSGGYNVNVHVESVSKSQVTVKTSAPVTGQIHLHAMYIEGCGPSVVTPIIYTPPVLGPAVPGGGPIITPPIVIE